LSIETMPIDGIGKPPAPPPPAGGTDGPKRASEATRPFEVGGARTEGATEVDSTTAATSPLARLKAGEIDLGGYLDARVEEATSHLEGLDGDELGAIRAHLRAAIASDPALAELVRQATGQVPAQATEQAPEPERE
jgi:hypothetical protein